MKKIIIISAFLLSFVNGFSQEQIPDSITNGLAYYAYAIENFGNTLPQEMVYLHFDNTSYYRGDQIWFQSYVVTSGLNRPTELSKTLYVELLNPGGEIIAKRTLPIEDGRCHGSFPLTHLPFYSGFYEVRAYTKYMLNFGEEAIYSRIFPVFERPKQEGDFTEKTIQRYAVNKYPRKRELSKKAKKVNLKFYPEGGSLIEDIPCCVAFEATDAYGNPMELSGTVVDKKKNELTSFAVEHEGRGMFVYTPSAEGEGVVATVDGKQYRFDLPKPLKQGFTLHIDNLVSADNLVVTVQKNQQTPEEVLGLVVISRGKPLSYCMLNIKNNEAIRFKLDKSEWPAGVAQAVLFNTAGQVLADRLFFTRKAEQLAVNVRKEKDTYQPFELIELDFSVRDTVGNPVSVPLSVSVRDGEEEVENRHSLLTGLLLMSEIKGYVHKPSYYFEADDYEHRSALDQLLMVQGWRRYVWKQWTGMESFELKYLPEQGIEVHGEVLSMVRKKPKADVQISSFLQQRGEEDREDTMEKTDKPTFIDSFSTDSLGRFAFSTDITGKWSLILSVMEKGKKKDHRIILDRVFSPEPVKYPLAEMQIHIAGTEEEEIESEPDEDTDEEDFNTFMQAYEDSLKQRGIDEKIHRLDEVVVKAKRRGKEADIYENRARSIAFYDVASEIDDITDNGKYIGDDIHELMINMNPNFVRWLRGGNEYLRYKGKAPLFVINYERTMATEMDYNKYKLLTLESIKSIYINEDFSAKSRYADPRMSPMDADELYSCVVFIETHPSGQIPVKAGKGVRKTWIDGYSESKEFYQPDYSVLPEEDDYRRTLYWNPELKPDEAGNAQIRFYNNSRCRKLRINAETISADGIIGVLDE